MRGQVEAVPYLIVRGYVPTGSETPNDFPLFRIAAGSTVLGVQPWNNDGRFTLTIQVEHVEDIVLTDEAKRSGIEVIVIPNVEESPK